MNGRIKTIIIIALVAVFTAAQSHLTFAQATKADGADGVSAQGIREKARKQISFVPGRVLVKYRDDRPVYAYSLMNAEGAREASELPGTRVRMISLPEGTDERAFVQALRLLPDVEFAELDELVPPSEMIPNDPSYGSQWHLPMIQTPAAWSTTSGTPNVTIAIIDTGVDPTHPDLQSKLVPGWNFWDNNADSSDVYGHGTAVAGTAAALGNNGVGVASIAWGCQIMPIRICDPSGSGSLSAMANGLIWAADRGARVANISYQVSDSLTVKSAAQYFQSKGGVVTIAAGNDGSFDSTSDNPYVLTVGATNSADALAGFSTTGNNIDLTAPGVGIQTLNRDSGYAPWSGTSFSAPIVAGVAALVISANPNLAAAQVQNVIKQSVDDLGSAGWDPSYGWGRVNAARAVDLALQTVGSDDNIAPSVNINSLADGGAIAGAVNVQATASDNVGLTSITFSVDGAVLGTTLTAPCSFPWDTEAAADGAHIVSVTATDATGNIGNATISVIISNAPGRIPPVVNIVSPAAGGAVSGNVSVEVNATAVVAIDHVELYIDGVLTDTSRRAPFTIRWNSRKAGAGTHSLQCKAYDTQGNVGTSPIITVVK
jgi:subtilisin family serine protease